MATMAFFLKINSRRPFIGSIEMTCRLEIISNCFDVKFNPATLAAILNIYFELLVNLKAINLKLCMNYRVTCRSKIAKIVTILIQNDRTAAIFKIFFELLLLLLNCKAN